jgi:hypothetical protein
LAKKCLHGPPGAGHRVSQDAPPAPYPKTVIASFVSMSLEAILADHFGQILFKNRAQAIVLELINPLSQWRLRDDGTGARSSHQAFLQRPVDWRAAIWAVAHAADASACIVRKAAIDICLNGRLHWSFFRKCSGTQRPALPARRDELRERPKAAIDFGTRAPRCSDQKQPFARGPKVACPRRPRPSFWGRFARR